MRSCIKAYTNVIIFIVIAPRASFNALRKSILYLNLSFQLNVVVPCLSSQFSEASYLYFITLKNSNER
jgi:hypothetical protein